MRRKSTYEKKFESKYSKVIKTAGDKTASGKDWEVDRQVLNKERQLREHYGDAVFDLQETKALIMQSLHAERACIDNKELLSGDGLINRNVVYNEDDGDGYFVITEADGDLTQATLGDLVTDIAYGIEHTIDTKAVPRNVLNQYVLEKAKAKIRQLFDIQLLLAEEARLARGHDSQFRNFISSMRTSKQKKLEAGGEYREKSSGLLFEQQMIDLIKQLEIDLPDLSISIAESDTLEDIHDKVDFVVEVVAHKRGVYVEKEDQDIAPSEHVFGIQFTTNTSEDSMQRKEQQVFRKKRDLRFIQESKLDDLLLVAVPVTSNEVVRNYRVWEKLGKPSGGPAKLYDTNTKLQILEQLFQGIGQSDLVAEHREELVAYYDSKLSDIDQAVVAHNIVQS